MKIILHQLNSKEEETLNETRQMRFDFCCIHILNCAPNNLKSALVLVRSSVYAPAGLCTKNLSSRNNNCIK